jgi:hypothetical protein
MSCVGSRGRLQPAWQRAPQCRLGGVCAQRPLWPCHSPPPLLSPPWVLCVKPPCVAHAVTRPVAHTQVRRLTSFAFSCWISEAIALMTALLLATRFSCGRITTRAAAVAKCSAARVLSADPGGQQQQQGNGTPSWARRECALPAEWASASAYEAGNRREGWLHTGGRAHTPATRHVVDGAGVQPTHLLLARWW